MRVLPLCAAALLAGCEKWEASTTTNPELRPDAFMVVYHDDTRDVTCWSRGSSTLSCLPDWMLERKTP